MRKKQKSKKSCKLQKTKTRKEKRKTCSMAQNSVWYIYGQWLWHIKFITNTCNNI